MLVYFLCKNCNPPEKGHPPPFSQRIVSHGYDVFKQKLDITVPSVSAI